jgi:2-succinyl-6-hydroxy-2,4-cyclohexadiene-1-carboxylate synthase
MARVLLHGFAGSGASWAPVVQPLGADAPYTPDLRGHGHRSGARPVSFAACVADVLAEAPPRFTLAGYSLGGRVALHVALAAPQRVQRLVLVATTAGIEDRAAREARRQSDEALAAWLLEHGIAAFADRWAALELWDGDPPAARAAQRADVLASDPAGLAAALRGIGTGAMEPLWDRLGELGMPAVVVAGARDARYVALAERLAAGLPDAELVVVDGAGHGLVREAPAALARILA